MREIQAIPQCRISIHRASPAHCQLFNIWGRCSEGRVACFRSWPCRFYCCDAIRSGQGVLIL